MLIEGEWVEARHGRTLEVYDPALGEVIDHVPAGDAEDIDVAVTAARRALEDSKWSRLTASERGRLIWRIGDLILENADELATIESIDNGKPFAVARAADVPLAADLFHYMAGFATKTYGQTFPVSVPYAPGVLFDAYTLKEPVGVVGQIIPWNFPLLMAAWKLGPALATGCTVVLKPAEQTPLSALRLAELMLEAEIPNGVINVVTGFGETAGAAVAAHRGIDKVAFTGSTEVGKLIVEAAADDLRRVTLELGGKSPNVVFADADLETAIPGAANAIFFNHGQCCCAGSRLYIERKVYDDVLAGVADHADHIKVGRGLELCTEMGPLVSAEQLERVTGYLDSARSEGVRTVVGGGQAGDQGYFVAPTVLDGARPGDKVFDEEIFGPVVTAIPFTNPDEVAPAANETVYGLAAGIWTNDLTKARRLIPQLKAGTVWVNMYNIFDAALPFGGYKQSGWGREMGEEVIHEYTETKAVCIGLLPDSCMLRAMPTEAGHG
jgi:phenylacetaldehyde dehydrogenase